MTFASLQFLIPFLVISAVFFYLPAVRWRQALLAACNAAFLYFFIPNAASWAALGIFLISGFAVGLLVRMWPSRIVLSLYLIALVLAFLLIRKYDLIVAHLPESLLFRAVSIVGLSYMLFRQIAFLVDALQGQVDQISLWSYANYQLNLFTLLSGPIQRYQDFYDQWKELSPTLEDRYALQRAYMRLLVGIVKLTTVAPAFMSVYQKSAEPLINASGNTAALGRLATVGHFFGVLYFYPIYLYLNFAGYCDIVIAGASLIGMTLPENFNEPYLARNMIDYWTRFHRTLGFWIRDYLFLPMYKGVAVRWPQKADSLAFLCYFVAFFVAGIWHGPSANFVIFGILQGLGVSAAKLWERHLLKRHGRTGLKTYLQSHRIRVAAIIGTLHFEFFSLLFFPIDLHTAVNMLRTVITTLV